jgi:hypothetical protein
MEKLYGMTNQNKIEEYVFKNYKTYKGHMLIITENSNHYSIKKHPDGAPLVLSKDIV